METTTTNFHLDPNSGNPVRCGKEGCQWAPPEKHYATPAEARRAYESLMTDFKWVRMRKRPNGKHELQIMTAIR